MVSIPIVQGKGQEIMDALQPSFVHAIKKYHVINNEFPGRIVNF